MCWGSFERAGDGEHGAGWQACEARAAVAPGGAQEPYWLTLNEGEHLGYYRGARVGKWMARYRRAGTAGNYQEATIAEADDRATLTVP